MVTGARGHSAIVASRVVTEVEQRLGHVTALRLRMEVKVVLVKTVTPNPVWTNTVWQMELRYM